MKNWYKISKMIDATENDEVSTYIFCDKCKRGATRDITDGNKVVWKEYFNMSPAEQQEYDLAHKSFQVGKSKIISKMCPDCQKDISQY